MKRQLWFSSDFHFNHKNIVKSISTWENKDTNCRDFDSLTHHNNSIISNINICVKEDDILYFIGDWSFGNLEDILFFRKQIKCKNIHFIIGNHDTLVETKRSQLLGQDKFLTISHMKEIKVGNQTIVMSHYPLRDWNKAKEGSWCLHGHNHGRGNKYKKEVRLGLTNFFKKQTFYYKTMDVGIDTHPTYRPWSYDAIEQFMKNRINLDIEDEQNKI